MVWNQSYTVVLGQTTGFRLYRVEYPGNSLLSLDHRAEVLDNIFLILDCTAEILAVSFLAVELFAIEFLDGKLFLSVHMALVHGRIAVLGRLLLALTN